jgi:phage shock protein PspC (stress-responsive transcriptional regulator)
MQMTQCGDPNYDRTQAPDQHRVEGLRRPIDERVLGGVAAAMAGWLNIDVRAVRIAFVVLAVLGGAAVPLYAAGWLLIPEEGAELSIGQELARTLRRQ